jgi:hypothetical protein
VPKILAPVEPAEVVGDEDEVDEIEDDAEDLAGEDEDV